jgi:hypothetical protein
LYKDKTVAKAVGIEDISLLISHRWLDEWNESRYDDLFPK